MKDKCPGSGMEPRCTIQNDWFIGVTCVCPFCGRSCKLPRNGKMPTHKMTRACAAACAPVQPPV